MDWAGFEFANTADYTELPTTSTMSTWMEFASIHQKNHEITTYPDILEEFPEFMKVNLSLEKRTVRETGKLTFDVFLKAQTPTLAIKRF